MRTIKIRGVAFAQLAFSGLVGCAGSSAEPTEPEEPKVATIALDLQTATLARGQALDLRVTLRDAAGRALSSRPLAWSSTDPSVVQVEANGPTGKVLAGAAGNATVRASIGGVSATSLVTVVGFASATAGQIFSCAISTGGKLYCAGTPYGPAAIPVSPQTRFNAVSIGGLPSPDFSLACAIAVDQRAWCWGANGAGQLGTGDLTTRAEPTLVAGDLRFTSISVGNTHVCGITTNEQTVCWGEGAEGRLGTGDTGNRSAPTEVSGPAGVVFTQVDAGAFATCALAVTGKAYCWGRNDLGQLGSSKAPLGQPSLLPVEVEGPESIALIVTKGPKSCLLDSGGRAYCSGDNTVGGLGSGGTTQTCFGDKPCSPTPLAVQTSQAFVALAASQFATCGLTASGLTLCWGMDFENLFGSQAGAIPACQVAGATYPCTATPVPGATGLKTLTASRTNECGMGEDGIAYCWGGNTFGQRGWPGSTADPTRRAFTIAPTSAP